MAHTPLLLVPGLMCDHTVWEPVIPAQAQHAQPYVVDHGNEDNLTRMAERLLAQAPAQFALAGHSMGGRVALEVLRLAPQRVLRLALLDTGYLSRSGGPAGEEEARKRHALLELARTRGVRAMAQAWVQGMVHPGRLNDATLIADIIDMFERKSADTFANQIRALLDRPDATPVLQSVAVPTLVLCGRQDSWAPVEQHQEIAALIPDGHASLEIVEQSGHMSPMEQPDAVAEALRAWLTASSRQTA
jgi:pimeloyl-ACP methyl ester carboxylesterase